MMTTTVTLTKQQSLAQHHGQRKVNAPFLGTDPSCVSSLLEARSSWTVRVVGGKGRGGLLRVGHQGLQMGFTGTCHMHLNEFCSKFHCTEVNLDVNIV